MGCSKPKCIEAMKNATALVAGRGPSAPQNNNAQPKQSYNTSGDSYINKSGGITVSKKFKKGIIQ